MGIVKRYLKVPSRTGRSRVMRTLAKVAAKVYK